MIQTNGSHQSNSAPPVPPQGSFGFMSADNFGCHNWVGGRRRGQRYWQLVGRSQDALSILQQAPTTKTQPAQNALSAQPEKPCSSPL